MSMLKEFKEFAMRGNVIDLAVGIVIGAAFTKIVNSLVGGVFTPVTAYLTGNTDVSDMTFPLPAIGDGKGAEIGWGSVVQATVEFIIVAFALFLVVKIMNKLKRQEPPPPKAPTEEILLLREIRDSLAKRA